MRTITSLAVLLCFAMSGDAQTPKSTPIKKDAAVDRYGDPLPDGAIARLGTVRFRHSFGAQQIEFSPNGKFLASSGRFPGGCLYDAETGRRLHQAVTPSESVAFSPDGSKVLFGRHLIETATGKVLQNFNRATNVIENAVFAPDGKTIASADARQKANIGVWNADNGTEVCRLPGHDQAIRGLAFSPKDPNLLASAGEDKTVRLWNVAATKEMHRLEGHEKGVYSVAFAPDGKTLASAGEDGVIRLWNVVTGKPIRVIHRERGEIYHVTFSRNGKLLASCGEGGTIHLWNPDTGKADRKIETGLASVRCVAFAPDGKTLAASSFGAIRRWNFETGVEIDPRECHQASLLYVQFSGDGKRLFSSGQDLRVFSWDLESSKADLKFLGYDRDGPGHMFWRSTHFSGDGKIVLQVPIVLYPDAKREAPSVVYLRNTTTGKVIHALRHPKQVTFVRVSADGKRFASGGDDGLRLWDVATGSQTHHLLEKITIAGLTFSPDGKTLAAAGRDSRIHLCDVATGKELRTFESGENERGSVVFTPDGKSIATTDGNLVHVWSVDAGKEIMSFVANSVFTLAVSPDGRTIVLGGVRVRDEATEDIVGQIELRELRTGQMIRQIHAPQSIVRAVAISPDSRTLASGGNDSTILLWDLTGHAKTKLTPPGAADLDKLWADLAADASKADGAHWTLALSPKHSVPFLKERLRPARPADAEKVAQLLADLDSKSLDARQKAERALINLGESAESALRKSLEAKLPLEHRRRVEKILAKRDPDVLRQLRAVDTLAEIGVEARPVMEVLARESPNPRVRDVANAALKRGTQ